MSRPLALDLFCKAGGVSMGLHRAGFDVIGVDIEKQKNYPFAFVQADALNPPFDLARFDFIWASPPCQAHTSLRKMWNARQHEDRIPETRALLEASGVPWVMENVPGAPLRSIIMLCGTMFDLMTPCRAELRRHRYFECSPNVGTGIRSVAAPWEFMARAAAMRVRTRDANPMSSVSPAMARTIGKTTRAIRR